MIIRLVTVRKNMLATGRMGIMLVRVLLIVFRSLESTTQSPACDR